MGPAFDRQWMVVDDNGHFLSQRELPKMALIEPLLKDGQLIIRLPDGNQCEVISPHILQERIVTVWNSTFAAYDEGDEVALFLSDYLKQSCRLVKMPAAAPRAVNPKYALSAEDRVGFADGYPFLLISQASLDDLNQRLATPVPMNRFRPNLVISGCEPYDEDQWKSIQIGDVKFRVVKPCKRCVVITIEQSTAVKGQEPLRTLAKYRRQDSAVMFGQNLIHENQGVISVGDEVLK